MLILHPSSACDICLEGYNSSNLPHAISCGHIFCLRCLHSLTRQCCPLCRANFHPSDLRRLHIDKGSQPTTPVAGVGTELAVVDNDSFARTLLSRVNHVVLEGTGMAVVEGLLDHVHQWLSSQPEDQFTDLRAAHLMLYKITTSKAKSEERKARLAMLEQECRRLEEQLEVEKQLTMSAQDLVQEAHTSLSLAHAKVDSLTDRLEKQDAEWKTKLERCQEDCRRLEEELRRTRSNPNPLPQPPRSIDAFWLSSERFPTNPSDAMALSRDNTPTPSPARSRTSSNEDKFRLSPIPATIAITSLSSHTQTFKPLTEDSDTEELRSRNPYLLRSVQPITIRQMNPRTLSNPSLISRNNIVDLESARSTPRASVDVQMGSCSSSPSVSSFQYGLRDRRNDNPSPIGMITDSPLVQRPASTRRGSLGPQREIQDQEAQLRELRELLADRAPTMGPPPPPQSRRFESINEESRRRSADSSKSGTRNTSPVRSLLPSTASNTRSTSPITPTPASQTTGYMQHQTPQRQPVVSRASTAAAIQMEQQRARANSLKEQSTTPTPVPHVTPTRDRDRENSYQSPQAQQQQQQAQQMKVDSAVGYHHSPSKPSYPRRQSTDSVRSTRPGVTPAPPASNLGRTLWSMQEAQRLVS